MIIHKQVAKSLAKLQPKVSAAILADMEAIAADPYGHHSKVRLLTDRPNYFRYRHGGWRVLYRVERSVDTLFVEHMDTRGDIY